MNQYLTCFLPGGDDQWLSQDDLLKLLKSSIPNSWQKEFTRTGFDPVDGTIADFVDHCERVEVTEDTSPHNKQNNKSKSSRRQKGQRPTYTEVGSTPRVLYRMPSPLRRHIVLCMDPMVDTPWANVM